MYSLSPMPSLADAPQPMTIQVNGSEAGSRNNSSTTMGKLPSDPASGLPHIKLSHPIVSRCLAWTRIPALIYSLYYNTFGRPEHTLRLTGGHNQFVEFLFDHIGFGLHAAVKVGLLQ